MHNDPSKGSLLEHDLKLTGSEQCWAAMFGRYRGVSLPNESRDVHNDPSKGSEQCWVPMFVNYVACTFPLGLRDLHIDPSQGSPLEHILNHTDSEQ